MAFQETITYDTAASLSFDATAIEVSGGLVRLKDQGGGTYVTTNPSIITQHQNLVSTLSSFAESSSVSGSDAVKYQILVNGKSYYYNTGSTQWMLSDGTYATTNLAAELNSNFSTFFAQITGLPSVVFFSLQIYLHSASGSTRPTLTSNTIGYTFLNSTPAVINHCLIYSYLGDLLGNIPTYNATFPVTLHIKNERSFYHGNTLILPFDKTSTFNSSGYAQLSIIETATPGEALSFFISYFEGNSRRQVRLFNAIVPNTGSQSLSQISTVKDYDFG